MNNCNKCYYNSYLHDKYLINNNKLKINYKNYKLKNILNLDLIKHKNEHKNINKLKILTPECNERCRQKEIFVRKLRVLTSNLRTNLISFWCIYNLNLKN